MLRYVYWWRASRLGRVIQASVLHCCTFIVLRAAHDCGHMQLECHIAEQSETHTGICRHMLIDCRFRSCTTVRKRRRGAGRSFPAENSPGQYFRCLLHFGCSICIVAIAFRPFLYALRLVICEQVLPTMGEPPAKRFRVCPGLPSHPVLWKRMLTRSTRPTTRS